MRHRSEHAPLPAAWAEQQRNELGEEEALRLFEALDRDPPVSIRINPLKPVDPGGSPIPWCAQGRILDQRPVFTLDPLYHAGCYYVQEASSMLLEQALIAAGVLDRPVLALDLCAAPGGKSTHLLALLEPGSNVVSNEANRSRQNALIENIVKWGAPGSIVTGGPAAAFGEMGPVFDLVIVDAPCSGEGMFRKDHFARAQWNPGLVQRCASTQRSILEEAWGCLAAGGIMIYSTCTWEHQENEQHVERLIAQHGAVPIRIPSRPGGEAGSELGLRTYPHRSTGEGFFIAAVKRPGETGRHPIRTMPAMIDELRSRGVPVLFPGSDEAIDRMSDALRAGAVHDDPLELNAHEAMRYLRGEALSARAASGLRVVTHRGSAIGLVKGAGNRWNNLHPKHWRIRMR